MVEPCCCGIVTWLCDWIGCKHLHALLPTCGSAERWDLSQSMAAKMDTCIVVVQSMVVKIDGGTHHGSSVHGGEDG